MAGPRPSSGGPRTPSGSDLSGQILTELGNINTTVGKLDGRLDGIVTEVKRAHEELGKLNAWKDRLTNSETETAKIELSRLKAGLAKVDAEELADRRARASQRREFFVRFALLFVGAALTFLGGAAAQARKPPEHPAVERDAGGRDGAPP